MTERSVVHDTIVIERKFDAAPARVFAAWADPAAFGDWDLVGEGWAKEVVERDFSVGGRDRTRYAQVGGETYLADSRFDDIVPGRRIVSAYAMYHKETRLSVSLATVELLDEGSGTRMIYTDQVAFLDGGDTADSRTQGITQQFDSLEATLSGNA